MSKKSNILFPLVFLFISYLSGTEANADTVLTGALDGVVTTTGDVSTIGDCYVGDNLENATITTSYSVALNAGFYVETGKTFSIVILINSDSDGDSMSDAWEIAQFGNLTQTATGDYDGDGVTNYWEYALGLSPTTKQLDSDKDGLPDWYEVSKYQSLGHSISNGDCDCE
jgi:hypothetical protein